MNSNTTTSLNMIAAMLPCGDPPPHGSPLDYYGTYKPNSAVNTMLANPNPLLTMQGQTTIDNITYGMPEKTWVGDFPPFDTFPPYVIPNNNFWIYPTTFPIDNSWVTVTPTPWRTEIKGDQIILSVDMPGVRPQDVSVEIENGWLKATGRRFDTGLHVVQQCQINSIYDPNTASASIEMGVLTVTISRLKQRNVQKVPVVIK